MKFFTTMFFLAMTIVMYVSYRIQNKSLLDKRKEQSMNSARALKFKKDLEDTLESNTSFAKKRKVETMCVQAGLKLRYGEYKIICFITAILLPILFYGVLKNEYLTVASFVLGFTIPSQVITFIRNRRMNVLDKQIGSFLQMVTERYANTKDFAKAIRDCSEDFKGAEPFYSELRDTVMEIDLGVPTGEAIKNLSLRTGNKYVRRLGDYYSLSIQIGTDEARSTLLKQAFYQYEENRTVKNNLKMAISGPANEAYLMIAFIPITMAYNAFTNAEYLPFMTTTQLGKIGVAGIFSVIIGCLWLVNTKISAPIDE